MTTPPDTAPPPPPRSLGRYELVHPLGQGGMGEVWLARITGAAGFEKLCIVKTVLPALLSDRQFLDRFHHEARVLTRLVHSNIAQVFDMGEADGVYFMALEYVEGLDLSTLQEHARNTGAAIPVPIAVAICQRVADGLAYAHRRTGPEGEPLGIVHRDVSPHNVMVSYEGEIKVIDFGLATSAARSRYTLPSTVMGKLGYMSPEQARAEPLDQRTDIFSTGVILWELLAGRPLVDHGTLAEMVAAMANPRPRSLTELRPEVPAELDAIVQRALAPRPEDRFSRAEDLSRALQGFLMRTGTSVEAEDVGHLVVRLCPGRFEQHWKMLAKVSTPSGRRAPPAFTPSGGTPALTPGRGTPALTPGQGLAPVPPAPADPGLADTHLSPARALRGGTAAFGAAPAGQDDATARTLATPAARVPMVPVERIPPAPPRSRVPLAVAALALLLLLAGGLWAWRTQRAPAPVAQAPAPQADAPPASAQAPAPQEAPAADAPAGKPTAEPVAPSPAVAEAPATPKPAAPKPAPAQRTVPFTRRTRPVVRGPEATSVLAGTRQGLVHGATLTVVRPNGRTQPMTVVGTAHVDRVRAASSTLTLDASARAALAASSTTLLVLLPEPTIRTARTTATKAPAPKPPEAAAPAPAAVTATTPAPAPPIAPRPLQGRISVSDFPFKTINVHNTDDTTWTECKVWVAGKGAAWMGSLAPGGVKRMRFNEFRPDATARAGAHNAVAVTCWEGRGDFAAKL